jgi:diguanylate cyclase (GGDEF)-like protein/PAS domain S-box-containing protein
MYRELRARQHAEQRYGNLFEGSSALICTHDTKGNLLSINPSAAHSLGLAREECLGGNIRDILVPEARANFDAYLKSIEQQGFAEGTMRVMGANGMHRVWTFANRLIKEPGQEPYVLGHALDITELVRAQQAVRASEEQLAAALAAEKELARSDPLTGLPNRRAFYEIALAESDRARRYRHPLSLAYLDVDNFKQVNDDYGHDAGDELLVRVAEVLRRNLRNNDVVARLGGDEFAMLLPETPQSATDAVIGKLQAKLNFAAIDNDWPVNFSIGMVTFSPPPADVDEMLRAADQLMYSVKRDRKSRLAPAAS